MLSLSPSLWVWWSLGPRPKQGALYLRRLGLVEAGAFAAGVDALALGALLGSRGAALGGAAALCAAAVLRRRPPSMIYLSSRLDLSIAMEETRRDAGPTS